MSWLLPDGRGGCAFWGKEPPEVWENIPAVIPHEELSGRAAANGLSPCRH